MPHPLTAYRVFIASPGGLKKEREHFRKALDSYNEREAIERSVIFLPMGWEDTVAGLGRPQELINKDVQRCDYFVLLLWDRWGTPTHAAGQPGGFTAGIEEEFAVARRCYQARTMRDIIVFFKELPPDKEEDPGDKLKPVLEFRRRLEEEKSLLYDSFDEPGTFADKLQKHLARWVRAHEEAQHPEVLATPTAPLPPAPGPGSSASEAPAGNGSESVQVEKLIQGGRIAEAEAVLAPAVVREDNVDAIYQYGKLMIETGSLSHAERAFIRLHEIANERDDLRWMVTALRELAHVHRVQRRHDREEAALKRALELQERRLGESSPVLASTLNDLAKLYATTHEPDKAIEFAGRALAVQGVSLAS